MGKKPDEIEREIAQHREAIGRKLGELKARVRDDATELRAVAGEDLAERTGLRQQAEQRPLVTVGAALGVGMVAGAISGGRRAAKEPAQRTPSNLARAQSPADSPPAGAKDSVIAELLGTITGGLSTTLQDELRQALRDLFDRKAVPSAPAAPQAPRFNDHLDPIRRDGEHTGAPADSESLQTRIRRGEISAASTSRMAGDARANGHAGTPHSD